jgi:cytochrome oxidase Cu insertion factor (SCO1/SenC/PrrC family)
MEDRLRFESGPRWALAALGLAGAVTVGWWAFALWPLPEGAAPALERARAVCFGTDGRGGLPDATGWALLLGQPVLMLSLLMLLWGGAVREGLRSLGAFPAGRVALACAATVLIAAGSLAAWRVSTGLAALPPVGEWGPVPDEAAVARSQPRLDREAPPLDLATHRGGELSLSDLEGRPALVTFVFAHCATVCPLVVRDALEAKRLSPVSPAVVVLTLDPWRDTPSRLRGTAEGWGMGDDAWFLGGSVEAVEAALDRWEVPRERDPATGDIAHPPLTYVLDGEGRIVFVSRGSLDALLVLLDRL